MYINISVVMFRPSALNYKLIFFYWETNWIGKFHHPNRKEFLYHGMEMGTFGGGDGNGNFSHQTLKINKQKISKN